MADDITEKSQKNLKLLKRSRTFLDEVIFELDDNEIDDLNPPNSKKYRPSDVELAAEAYDVLEVNSSVAQTKTISDKNSFELSAINNKVTSTEEPGECITLDDDTSDCVTIEDNDSSQNSKTTSTQITHSTQETIGSKIDSDEIDKIAKLIQENEKLKEEIQSLKAKLDAKQPESEQPMIYIRFKDKYTAKKYQRSLKRLIKNEIKCTIPDASNSELEINVFEYDVLEDMMIVDNKPSLSSEKSSECPLYDVQQKESRRGKCFNCDGSHQLSDCPIPRDYQRIAAKRQAFRANQKSNVRYHNDFNLKYSHLAPGKLSRALRKALGIHSHQLPSYIYKMRAFGYPPGWLKDALDNIESSLTIVSDKNDKINYADSLNENLIHEYPGFNVYPEPGTKDEHYIYNCPPMQEEQRKDNFLGYLRLQYGANNSDENINTEVPVVEMEISDVEPGEVGHSSEENEPHIDDDSLACLENKKLELLSQLDNETLDTTADNNSIEEDSDVQKGEKSYPNAESTPTSSSASLGRIKKSEISTPIVELSHYKELPDQSKFSIGMGPILSFENLPDALGKYKDMKNLLQKVRGIFQKKKNLNQTI